MFSLCLLLWNWRWLNPKSNSRNCYYQKLGFCLSFGHHFPFCLQRLNPIPNFHQSNSHSLNLHLVSCFPWICCSQHLNLEFVFHQLRLFVKWNCPIWDIHMSCHLLFHYPKLPFHVLGFVQLIDLSVWLELLILPLIQNRKIPKHFDWCSRSLH